MFLQSRNRLAVTENRLVFATGVRWGKGGLGIPDYFELIVLILFIYF